MEFTAKLSYLRVAPRKARLVADMVRGKRVAEAINILNYTSKRTAVHVAKLVQSAVAGADQRGEVDLDTLFIKRIFVDEGPTLRRFLPRAMGRATRINKRTSHITVVLDEK